MFMLNFSSGDKIIMNNSNVMLLPKYLVSRQCVAKSITVLSETAPGTDQSFTYVMEKNGLKTTLEVVLGARDTRAYSLSRDISLDKYDAITLSLNTSSGAAPCAHK